MMVLSQDKTILLSADQAVFFLELAKEGVLLKAKVGSIEYPLSDYMDFEKGRHELLRIFNYVEHNKPAVHIGGRNEV